MRQTELKLSEEVRPVIEGIRSKGWHQAQEINRARVPSCLDRAIPEAQIMAVLDVERSGRPCQHGTDAEARVIALACSTPPKGRQRWTMVELERAARQEPGMKPVRVRAQRHHQSVRGRRSQSGTANRQAHLPPQLGLMRLNFYSLHLCQ